MAYTRITNTTNGASAIRYAFEEPSHKEGMDRVLASSGSNLDPQFAMQQMRATWEAHGKHDGNTVQMYRIVQSFGDNELAPNDSEAIAKANAIGLELASEMYPDRQALIVTQADGKGGKLHNHILVNSVDFVNGKSLRGQQTNWEYVSRKSDEIIQRHGLKPLDSKKAWNKQTIAERKLDEQGKYVWKNDLKARIEDGLTNESVTSQDAFIERMRDDFEVDVQFRGKGISYAFTDEDGKERRIRSSRLGEMYGKDNIQGAFSKNKELQVPKEAVPQPAGFSFDFDLDNELNAIATGRANKKTKRVNKPRDSMQEMVQREIEALRREEEERKEQERKAEEQRAYEELERIERERQEQEERDQRERARKELEDLKRKEQEERDRQEQLQRKNRFVATNKKPSLLEVYQNTQFEWRGKTHYESSGIKQSIDGEFIRKLAVQKHEGMDKEGAAADRIVDNGNAAVQEGPEL